MPYILRRCLLFAFMHLAQARIRSVQSVTLARGLWQTCGDEIEVEFREELRLGLTWQVESNKSEAYIHSSRSPAVKSGMFEVLNRAAFQTEVPCGE